MTYYSYNEFHLGDNLIHLHFLRHMALANPGHEFVHAVHPCYMAQLNEVIEDMPNVNLVPLACRDITKELPWRNVWKNAGATVTDGGPTPNYVPGYWEKHPLKNDFAGFYLAWFKMLAEEMGLRSPFEKREDLLFDYPALLKTSDMSEPFDWLVVNSQPNSGQLRCYDSVDYLTPLILELTKRHNVITTRPIEGVRCTKDCDLSITGIGNLSLYCRGLLMISTGPSWPCQNRFNMDIVRTRIIMIDNGERVDYAPNTIQVSDRDGAREVLMDVGAL